MSNVADAILQFKDKKGSNGSPAKKLVKEMALSGNGFYASSLSHGVFKQRAEFIEQGAKRFFEHIDYDDFEMKPLDNGAESLVFDCGDDYVLKIKRGSPYLKRDLPELLQPVYTDYSQKLDVNYEIVPKVHKQGARLDQVMGMIVKSAFKGFVVSDPLACNFGWIKDHESQKERMVIIDRGAVYKGKNILHDVAHAGYSMVKAVAIPLYLNMPFLHKPWRAFKENVKSITAYERPSEYQQAPSDRFEP